MSDLIGTNECIELLKKYGDKDWASDLQLVRYYITVNELIIKIKYRDCDLKCVIDKLSFADGEIAEINDIGEFIETYLLPLPSRYRVKIEGEEKEHAVSINVSQN